MRSTLIDLCNNINVHSYMIVVSFVFSSFILAENIFNEKIYW